VLFSFFRSPPPDLIFRDLIFGLDRRGAVHAGRGRVQASKTLHPILEFTILKQMISTADLTLAYRIEVAEAANIAAIAEAAKGTIPKTVVELFAGGKAVFAGPGSPMTHAVGIGLSGPVSTDELERMEDFFRRRGSACVIDLCPLADVSVIAFVQSRHYRVAEFNNVMLRRIEPRETFAPQGGVREIGSGEEETWSRAICRGFAEYMPVTEEMVAMMSATSNVSRCWLAGQASALTADYQEAPGTEPLAGAALGIRDGIGFLYGDATLPHARRRGWQTELIRARLQAAQQNRCDLAMACVLPGSTSHRNYERAGFQLVYMRVNLIREFE
jgi:GNAT superfamily N-acetyltransferase